MFLGVLTQVEELFPDVSLAPDVNPVALGQGSPHLPILEQPGRVRIEGIGVNDLGERRIGGEPIALGLRGSTVPEPGQ